ncbi:MAG TPA: hypothetical protein VG123_09025 [Streptosporangiaceae bacterium]|nr:hypothetical protein [Streptosporangiaceae bacterium]
MHINQQDIDLATRVQRRRDFTAHVTGFLSGAIVLGCLLLTGASSASLYIATLLTWATALSFQHFRHVLRGPSPPPPSRPKPPGSAQPRAQIPHQAGRDPARRR